MQNRMAWPESMGDGRMRPEIGLSACSAGWNLFQILPTKVLSGIRLPIGNAREAARSLLSHGDLMYRLMSAMVLAGVLGHPPCHAQRNLPPGDPNLNADWDWTTDQPQTLFYHRPGQAPGRVQAALPFFCPGSRLYQAPGNRFKEDGWMLVHRDFGTELAAPAIPYFTLYNKYRGSFRVMLFNAAQAEDARVAGLLRLHPDGPGAPLLTFTNAGEPCFRSRDERGQVEVAFSPMDKVHGWAVFDFMLIGYDPDLGKQDARLLFTLRRLEPSAEEGLEADGPGCRGQSKAPIQPGLPGSDLLSLSLYLRQGGLEAQGHRPVQALPWGLFIFEAAPVLAEASGQAVLAQAPRLHLNPEAGLELLATRFEADVWSREPGAPDIHQGLWPISTEKGPTLSGCERVSDLIATLRFKTRQPTREADDCYTFVRRLPCAIRKEGESRLMLVSNRLPWTVAAVDGVPTLQASSGGLATALSRTHERSGTLWVGWPGDLAGLDPQERGKLDQELQRRRVMPVEISAAELEHYYEGFCNGVLWPLCHGFLDKIRLEMDQDWNAYVAVNERFARAAAARVAPGDPVWIHDYQLMLVPRKLRELRPDLRIGFFLHIPFPVFETFRVLPWRAELVEGLLGADLVGFQTAEDQDHFARTAVRVLGAEPAAAGLRFQGRDITLGTFGIGIDAEAFARAAASPAITGRVAEIRRELGGRTLILGVDRLDYSKGILQRLLALERYLEGHPDQRGRLLMLQVAVPSREGVPAYRKYRERVDQLAARINGRFGTPGWVPIHLLHQNFPFEGVVALYRAADVMLVTPLRDGMNLVAKEFCATRGEDSGVLILSEFAGAAQELREALLVNPYDTGAVAQALETALRMPEAEARNRMRALRRQVATHDVHRWSKAFVMDLEAQVAAPDPRSVAGERVVLFLDYDGTLVPFAPRPEGAAPDPELLALLERLGEAVEVHLVSGRPRETLEAWFGRLPLRLHAEHGLWRKDGPDAPWAVTFEHGNAWKQEARAVMQGWCREYEGSFLEEKSHSLVWHYRLSREPQDDDLAALREALRPLAESEGLEWLPGAKVLELRLRGVHKGLAADGVMSPGTKAVALGDDRTDEDLFRALPPTALTIRVGKGASCAAARLPDPAAARAFLAALETELAGRSRPAAAAAR